MRKNFAFAKKREMRNEISHPKNGAKREIIFRDNTTLRTKPVEVFEHNLPHSFKWTYNKNTERKRKPAILQNLQGIW